MIKLMLALRDVKAEMFMQPFFVPTVGVAYRNLQDEMERQAPDNPLANHAGDFELYQIGAFDDETGLFEPNRPPFKLVDVAALGAKAPAVRQVQPLQ